MSTNHVKPAPIGIKSKQRWIEKRFWNLANACKRYGIDDCEIPNDWKEEMRSHFGKMTTQSIGYNYRSRRAFSK